jgi:putative phosphoesterase
MRVLVISDSHGSVASLRAAVKAAGDIDCAIHLGDYTGDSRVLSEMTGLPVYAVRGNCDLSLEYESEEVICLEGARIYATHGHKYGVNAGIYGLAQRAEELGCCVALYGHTHVSAIEAQGRLLLVNPGSPFQPRQGRKRSVAVLTIAGKDVFPKIVTF